MVASRMNEGWCSFAGPAHRWSATGPSPEPAGSEGSPFAQAILSLLASLGLGVIVLDDERRVLQANVVARGHFGDGIALRDGRLTASDRAANLGLREAIKGLEARAALVSALPLGRGSLGLPRAAKCPLVMRIVRIEGREPAGRGGARFVVVLFDPDDCPQPSPDILAQLFDCTPGESRVAAALAAGKTLDQIASERRVSGCTVRAQANALFAKTRTSRQAELVALLTRLAPISRG